MRLGLQITSFTWEGGAPRIAANLASIAQAAEAAGFASIAVGDHLWQHPMMGGVEMEMLEAYSTLSYIAAHTSQVSLLTVVTSPTMRAPALLAKSVTTLDVLSGGRAWLGIGAGGWGEDTEALGMPSPPLRTRYELLEETLRFCDAMWTGERGTEKPFHGKHINATRVLNSPQAPHRPRILIGGDGEKRTLPLVARYADACSLRPVPELPKKLDLLKKYCDEQGRDYDAIEKTCVFYFDTTKVDEMLATLRRWAAMGIQTVYGRVPGADTITPFEVLGREVIPAIAEL
jgi:alkanesulfonate monooxygenase SsuD/methylene tetrahydromethanopterin reductase-like flavin-dependent oxidoreductase (luciferase family)